MTGVNLTDTTDTIFVILHLNVSRLNICSSCFLVVVVLCCPHFLLVIIPGLGTTYQIKVIIPGLG